MRYKKSMYRIHDVTGEEWIFEDVDVEFGFAQPGDMSYTRIYQEGHVFTFIDSNVVCFQEREGE